ncbi:VOC family protein [Halomonas sp. ML-15]|uniref:VOC family protein n=1 Tax=Halomonas sp. ML-15 TaxID=2773305 RepID=UPI0017479640|nr:VOC family protein [Halomonas sp. ML-15]MBD3894530.1 VOC family protein [Halomonas sp. ML-15]
MINGYSHVGVSTHDMEGTIYFYTNILEFKRVLDELTRINEGGALRQVYFDVGGAQYIVFMEPKDIEGIASNYDAGINGALGLPGGMYHFSFRVNDIGELESWREKLEAHSVDVSSIIDLGHASSIFFSDPNGIQLELSCQTRPFYDSDINKESYASLAL